MMESNNEPLDDYLVNDPTEIPEYKMASREKRFANYIIDAIVFYGVLIVVFIMYTMNMEDDFFYQENAAREEMFLNILIYIIYPMMYACFEYFTNGKTIGKFATRTRVVRRYEGELTFLRAMGRSFARLIPFEAFSIYMGRENVMWHDSLADTMVVEDIQ